MPAVDFENKLTLAYIGDEQGFTFYINLAEKMSD